MLTNCLDQISRLYEHTDAIMICDKFGYVEYVKWMDKNYFSSSEAIGKHITEVYPELTDKTSTVMLALKTGNPRYDERQVIKNYKGDLIDIVTTTLPIFNNNELIGAMTASVFFDKYKNSYKNKIKNKERLYVLNDIITQDPIMTALKERCRIIAGNDSPVLLYGETGTGKELFAQSLHTCSGRIDKPFISQNCAAIPESLLEGIFFGAEKGSFTGAETRKGLFELADGGTLFLDEINSMDVSMQAKLLKIIEEQKVRRLGGYKDISFNARIICAMNQKPTDVLKLGKIREDLFYRISVVRIDIPPLRNRKADIK
ncbi:MAG: sigma 54-interacting transcriptional regulator, partial [Oscillospiraceae bacterium]